MSQRQVSQAIDQAQFKGAVTSRPAEHNRPRFALSRNLQNAQFGMIYMRDPQRVTVHHGHFIGAPGSIYSGTD
jgi:hypothetical protein